MHISKAREVPGGISPAEVEAHLELVLSSKAFRSSRRSQEFLRFVVKRALDGEEQTIKERTIAVEVFGRRLDYDSSEDSFVRVKAGEVRRRLTLYYESETVADAAFRIDVPVGSYIPRFLRTELALPSVTEAMPIPPRRTWRLRVTVAILLVVAALGLTWWFQRPSAIEQFWRPIQESPGALLIFLPQPKSYNVLSEDAALRGPAPRQEIAGSNPRQFVVLSPDRVGVGAAQGAIRFAVQCTRTGKPYAIKTGEDFSFADLRNQPCVIFGAFSSKWTVELNNEFRFRLIRDGADSRITDEQSPGQQWMPAEQSGVPKEDYAIAGRVVDSKSGQIVMIAAGITTFGTQAAAEFLTEPSRLEELAALAPGPLNRGNFQVLLHTRVIGNTPSPPKVVKAHFW
jgi:hypothetical protein